MSYGYGEFEGLTFVDSLDLEDEPYQFYIVGVWKDESGQYYLATDSGCSCPTPWEYTTRDELTGPLTREQAAEELTSLTLDAPRYTRDELPSLIASL